MCPTKVQAQGCVLLRVLSGLWGTVHQATDSADCLKTGLENSFAG